jgi:hypothetical protein
MINLALKINDKVKYFQENMKSFDMAQKEKAQSFINNAAIALSAAEPKEFSKIFSDIEQKIVEFEKKISEIPQLMFQYLGTQNKIVLLKNGKLKEKECIPLAEIMKLLDILDTDPFYHLKLSYVIIPENYSLIQLYKATKDSL